MTTRVHLFLTLIGCICLGAMATTKAFAATIYVNTNATGANTGLNWTNAFTDLQDALAIATNGDDIWVAAGVYKPTTTTNRDIAFEIPSGVSLFGGFSGTETALNQRDWVANATVLSGAIGSQTDITDNTRFLLWIVDTTNTIEINGLILRRAYHEDGQTFQISNASEVIFEKCVFELNTAFTWHIQAMNETNIIMNDCLFHSNTGPKLFVRNGSSSLQLNNCTIAGNDIDFISTNEIEFRNSIIWEPNSGLHASPVAFNSIVSNSTWLVAGHNNILADPLFMNPAANNYRLQPGSPAIDLGSNAFTSQGFDLDRNIRIYGTQPDAGCYEARVATRIYVDADASGLNNGANWANAFTDLQDAIAVSIPGDKIWVAEGTYYPTTGTSRSASFQLPSGVELYGGFNGTETNRNQRSWQSNLTILSGDIGVQGDASDNCYHVVEMDSMVDDYFLDGFVVESGNANSGSLNGEGGGITIQGANSAVVQNCWIRNNHGNRGGGIHMRSTPNNVVVQQSVFQNNTGDTGAAIYHANDPQIRSCLFVQNNAAVEGIVFAEEDAVLTMNNCTLTQNVLQTTGSHVVDGQGSGAAWLITNSIFWFNNHPNQVASIYDQGANALVSHCILQNNAFGGNQEAVFVGAPLFVNPLAGNFALQSASPGINAGDNSQVVETLDALGNERIRFGNVDIGAIEGDFVPAGVVFVDLDATGNNDGSSWTNAFTDLGDALLAAQVGQLIWVAEGVYISPGQASNFEIIWQMPDGVELLGGFDGSEWDVSQAAPWEHETIISGNAGNPSELADNVSGLIGCYDTYIGVRISGFTFQDVFRLNTFGRAAIAVFNSTNLGDDLVQVVVENCVFRDNYTGGGASCISLSVGNSNLGNQARVDVINCAFYHNSGADALIEASVGNSCFINVSNCTFTENSIVEPNDLRPMITGLVGTTITIGNTIFWNNDVPKEFINAAQVSHSIFEHSVDNGTNNLLADPLFVDPANLDFSLQSLSFAIGRGNNDLVASSIDLVGGQRIQEGTVDMGCIESPFALFDGILYVDIDATGNNDGSSWQDAFTDLGDALASAEAGDRIWVAEGVYVSPGMLIGFTPIWQLPDGVSLIGGFSGVETYEGQSAPWVHETILSGNSGDPNVNTDNSSGLLKCMEGDMGTYLYGLVFEDAYRAPNGVSGAPLLIYNDGASGFNSIRARLENCVFRNNVSLSAIATTCISIGSAFADQNSSEVELENCLFYGNSGLQGLISGGTFNVSIRMNNCTFTENSVNDDLNLLGLIHGFNDVEIDITNSIFWDNNAAKDFNEGANVSVTHSITTNNPLFEPTNINDNPLFVDPANHVYNLSANSPALNSGNNAFVSTSIDLAGNVRIQEGTVDRGCFEGVFVAEPSTCAGDFNQDGVVNASDLFGILGNFGSVCDNPFCIGDLNGDSVVNSTDTIIFLAAFGAVCQ